MLEKILTLTLTLLILCIYKMYMRMKFVREETKNLYSKELDRLKTENDILKENKVDINSVVSKEEYERMKQEQTFKHNLLVDDYKELSERFKEADEKNKKLVSQRQSNHVKLGQTAENFYAFLNEFPHNPEECVAIFKPIDLISFNKDKITFIEVKTGNSQLSSKQRNIKKLVEENKIFFETHRINERGVKIK